MQSIGEGMRQNYESKHGNNAGVKERAGFVSDKILSPLSLILSWDESSNFYLDVLYKDALEGEKLRLLMEMKKGFLKWLGNAAGKMA